MWVARSHSDADADAAFAGVAAAEADGIAAGGSVADDSAADAEASAAPDVLRGIVSSFDLNSSAAAAVTVAVFLLQSE